MSWITASMRFAGPLDEKLMLPRTRSVEMPLPKDCINQPIDPTGFIAAAGDLLVRSHNTTTIDLGNMHA